VLIVFAGLPGSGKTTIARRLAQQTGATYLRVDSLEQAMVRTGLPEREIGGIGYAVAQAIAADNLRLGLSVIADSVNPWQRTRRDWREVARQTHSSLAEIELICSDEALHRHRLETRPVDIPGHVPPTWQEVATREYHRWEEPHLIVDTAIYGVNEAVEKILTYLRELTHTPNLLPG